MSNAEIPPISPAASLSSFLEVTQNSVWRLQENVRVAGPLLGQAWATAQTEVINQSADDNCQLAGQYISWLQEYDAVPYVHTAKGTGRLRQLGLDSAKTYHLSALIGGCKHVFAIGNFVLVDTTEFSTPDTMTPMASGNRPAAKLSQLLVPRPVLTIPGYKPPFSS